MTLPKAYRKMLSYDGALRANPEDPRHYQCPCTHQNYFDPSNAVYGLVIDMVCPNLAGQWNIETKGDIIEALLGYHYNLKRIVPDAQCHAGATWVNEFFNGITYDVYKLWCIMEWKELVMWLQWIAATSAPEQNRRSPAVGQETTDRNYRPNIKNKGHLVQCLPPQCYGDAAIDERDDFEPPEWVE